jgi:hypothetical protein
VKSLTLNYATGEWQQNHTSSKWMTFKVHYMDLNDTRIWLHQNYDQGKCQKLQLLLYEKKLISKDVLSKWMTSKFRFKGKAWHENVALLKWSKLTSYYVGITYIEMTDIKVLHDAWYKRVTHIIIQFMSTNEDVLKSKLV